MTTAVAAVDARRPTPAPRRPRVAPADAQRIVVFRALMLGDMLCAVPALRALRRAYPQAYICLAGLPWCEALSKRIAYVDAFLPFPGFPGLPELAPDLAALPHFFSTVHAHRFDLALQLHGSGRLVNSIVAAFGAARTAAYGELDDYCPDPHLHCRWPTHGHEIERLLALTDTLGIERCGLQLEFPVTPGDLRAAAARLGLAQLSPFVCVHPGAQLPSRRWPVERFAAVAGALARDGWVVLITGTANEQPLARQIALQHGRIFDLTGRTTLWELGALVSLAQLVIANDTGISHIAAATRTPSVIVSAGADVARWAPLDTERHRVLWADVPCRPCSHRQCPTAHECAAAIDAARVIDAARTALSARREQRAALGARP